MRVSVVNPAQVRDFAKGLAVRGKTDASDRAVLARYGVTVKPLLLAARIIQIDRMIGPFYFPRKRGAFVQGPPASIGDHRRV